MPSKDPNYNKNYQKKMYYDRRKEAFKVLGTKCKQCGAEDDLEVANNLGGFSKIWSLSKVKFQEKLKESWLLCKKCKTEKNIQNAGRKPAKGKHGTISSYRYCRCELCKAAKSRAYYNYISKKPCSIEGCDEVYYARGYCRQHYNEFYRKPNTKNCTIEGCNNPHHAKGLCSYHYEQTNRTKTNKKYSKRPKRKTKVYKAKTKHVEGSGSAFDINTAKQCNGRKISEATRYHAKILLRMMKNGKRKHSGN